MNRQTFSLHREQAAALLKHRCSLIAYERDHDEAELTSGTPAACLPILRYVFINFSEGLDDYFRSQGHVFFPEMTDEQLVRGILSVSFIKYLVCNTK